MKAPLTYVKILVPNWRPFAELGLDFVYYTKEFYKQVELDYPVSWATTSTPGLRTTR